MGAKSRNKRRVAIVSPEILIRVSSPFEERCYTGKIKFRSLEDVPSNGFSGIALRGYNCTLCGWWHCTSGGTVKWRKPGRGNVQPGLEGRARR